MIGLDLQGSRGRLCYVLRGCQLNRESIFSFVKYVINNTYNVSLFVIVLLDAVIFYMSTSKAQPIILKK